MLRVGSAEIKNLRWRVCLQEFDQMVGLERSLRWLSSWLKKCLYSVGICGLFHWMMCITRIGDCGFLGL